MAAATAHRSYLQAGPWYFGLFAVLLLGFAAFIKFRGAADCAAQLNDGEWAIGHWHAHKCFLHHYQASEVQHCLSNFSDVVIVGDSIHLMYIIMKSSDSRLEHKAFIEGKYIDEHTSEKYSNIAQSLSGKAALIVDQPTQFYTPGVEDIIRSCADNIDLLISSQRALLKKAPLSRIVTLAPNALSDGTKEMLECYRLAEEKYSKLSTSSIVYLSAYAVPILERGSVRHNSGYLYEEFSLVLNVYCNTPCNATCCVHHERGHFYGLTGMLIILVLYGGLWLVRLTGATDPIMVYLEGCSVGAATLGKAFNYIGVMVLCAFYYTAAERLQLFHVTNKSYSPLLFCLWLALSLVAGIFTCAKGPQKFLSSEQSSTLIGWMGVVLVGLDYTAMDEIIWYYNWIPMLLSSGQNNKELMPYLIGDLLLGAVVLLFSYRQFMYFWECGSFMCRRVVMVLIKINTLPFFLMVLLGVSYFTYIIPLLLSFGFVIVYVSMATPVQITKVQVQAAQKKHIIFTMAKLLLLFLIISYVFSFKFVFSMLEVLLNVNCGNALKWLTTLNRHKHMPLYGVTLGYITSVLRLYQTSKYERKLKIAGFVISQAIIVGYCIWMFICDDPKFCVKWQSHFSVLPIVAGIYLCNCMDSLQTMYSQLFQHCGSAIIVYIHADVTRSDASWGSIPPHLKLYCSHLHILCSFKGHGLLTLFPNVSILNQVVAVGVFFLVAHQIKRAEDAFMGILKPSPPGSSSLTKDCLPNADVPQHV